MFEETIKSFMDNEVEEPLVRYKVKVPCNKREDVRKALESLGCIIEDEKVMFKDITAADLGKKVSITNPIVIASDIYIKTPLSKYKVKKVTIPDGLVGTIIGIGDFCYSVAFNCDIPLDPLDIVEGNLSDIPAYPLDYLDLTPEQITFL